MATITTSKTYCDRPGCEEEVIFTSDAWGSIKFSVYYNSRGYAIPSNGSPSADLCKSCASDLDTFWHAKKQ